MSGTNGTNGTNGTKPAVCKRDKGGYPPLGGYPNVPMLVSRLAGRLLPHRLLVWWFVRKEAKRFEAERIARNARRRELYARRNALRAAMLGPVDQTAYRASVIAERQALLDDLQRAPVEAASVEQAHELALHLVAEPAASLDPPCALCGFGRGPLHVHRSDCPLAVEGGASVSATRAVQTATHNCWRCSAPCGCDFGEYGPHACRHACAAGAV